MAAKGSRAWPPSRRLVAFPIFFFFLFTSFPSSHSLSDADLLLQFKSTIVDTMGVLGTWTPASTPCGPTRSADWTGVSCDAGGNVVKLILENMGLSGTLNIDPLVGLRAIKSMSFMNNDFEGPIPNVGQFVWLRSLYLSGNHLSGEIREKEFGRMLALSRVHLARNAFTGRIPKSLVGVTRLVELMVQRNAFVGGIPEFRQVGLRVNVSHNRLEGAIPVALAKLDPGAFIGNKNLCGPPLAIQCNFTAPPPAQQNFTEPPSALPPPHNPSDSATAKRHHQFPYFIAFIVVIILVVLAILVTLICILYRRRKEEECLGRPPSKRKRVTSLSAERMERPSPLHGGSNETIGKKVVKGNEHGRLVFVRGGREMFGLQDLLMASAEVLGSGSFGSSYKAVLTNDSATVVKRFKEMNAVCREDFSEHMRRLGRLSHPNLLPLVAYYYRREEKLLVFDYIPNGSLAHMLHGTRGPNDPKLDWRTRLGIVKGVARGMAYLHDELAILNLPHGHLKSSNVLLDGKFEPLLTDYALTPVTNPVHAANVMVAYKAPEVLQYGHAAKKADVWSLGILILEILTGKFPACYLFQGNNAIDMTNWVNSIVEAVPDGESILDKQMGGTTRYEQGEMMKLLQIGRSCCDVDEEKRWDLVEALDKIEEVKEGDVDEFSSCVSEAMAQDDISVSSNN